MKSFCVGLFTVLTVFAGTVFSKTCSHDHFYEMFTNQAPLKEILTAVYDNDSATQLKHFEAIQQHIDNPDDFTDYATELKSAAQSILDVSLQSIGHNPIDIGEYMKAAADIESGVEVGNQDLVDAIQKLKAQKQKMTAASEEEKLNHLNQLMSNAAKGHQHHRKHHGPAHRKIHFTSAPSPLTEENSENGESN